MNYIDDNIDTIINIVNKSLEELVSQNLIKCYFINVSYNIEKINIIFDTHYGTNERIGLVVDELMISGNQK